MQPGLLGDTIRQARIDNKLTQEMKITFIKDGIQIIQGEILCRN